MSKRDDLSRREFINGTAAVAAGVVVTAGIGLPRIAKAAPPVWTTIPDQVWVVGVPVNLDLADYCTDPESDPLTFALDQTLPPGVTLSGSVISGTPTAEFASQEFVASADDGEPADLLAPAPPMSLSVD